MFNNHTELLQFLAEKIKAKSYLEIGVSNRANNFDKINVQFKIGVDPNPKALANFCGTSDEFFRLPEVPMFHLIFIDGLHHAEQVQKDFENAIKYLYHDGYIVLHDTCPESEHLTHAPRDKKGRWLGDVYKFACRLAEYNGTNFCTLDFDNGCTVVWHDYASGKSIGQITWNRYITERKELLRIVPLNKFIEKFQAIPL